MLDITIRQPASGHGADARRRAHHRRGDRRARRSRCACATAARWWWTCRACARSIVRAWPPSSRCCVRARSKAAPRRRGLQHAVDGRSPRTERVSTDCSRSSPWPRRHGSSVRKRHDRALSTTHDLVVVANRLPVQRSSEDGDRGRRAPAGSSAPSWARCTRAAGRGSAGAARSVTHPAPFDPRGRAPAAPCPRTGRLRGLLRRLRQRGAVAALPRRHPALDLRSGLVGDATSRSTSASPWRRPRMAAPGAIVWVHDYQLQLVPAMLRELRPDVRIGFFLHIPFPPLELFSRLPWREQILDGLLGADVVGFQRRSGGGELRRRRHQAARRATAIRRVLKVGPRKVHIAAHPISIDVEELDEIARMPETVEQAWKLRNRLGSPKTVLLGVDRLDYTKGIVERLRGLRAVAGGGPHQGPRLRDGAARRAHPWPPRALRRGAAPGGAARRLDQRRVRLASGTPPCSTCTRACTLEELVAALPGGRRHDRHAAAATA